MSSGIKKSHPYFCYCWFKMWDRDNYTTRRPGVPSKKQQAIDPHRTVVAGFPARPRRASVTKPIPWMSARSISAGSSSAPSRFSGERRAQKDGRRALVHGRTQKDGSLRRRALVSRSFLFSALRTQKGGSLHNLLSSASWSDSVRALRTHGATRWLNNGRGRRKTHQHHPLNMQR